jgi:hypothetical protein
MEPLTGANRQIVLDTLQKYRDAGFTVDVDTLKQEMRGYSSGTLLDRISAPSKWDLILAGLSPKAVALRTVIPRALRDPAVLRRISGKGFESKITPKQVYPTKAAAMAARK